MAVDSVRWTVDRGRKVLAGILLFFCSAVYAETVNFESAVTWGAAGTGSDHDFGRGGRGAGVSLTDEGEIRAGLDSDVPAVFESVAVTTEGIVRSVTLSAETSGPVRFELSANNGGKYAPASNGVVLTEGFGSGTSLRWRARPAPGSILKSVTLQYTDSLGTHAGFGSPLLSGAVRRRGIQLMPPPETEYFNHPLLLEITLDEIRFDSVRFTLADGVTVIPHWLESVTGHTARVWIRVPEIAPEGMALYLYYDCGSNTSNPDAVRIMYEEARTGLADPELWTVDGYTEDMDTIDERIVAGMLIHLSTLPQPVTAIPFAEDEEVEMPELSGLSLDAAGDLTTIAGAGTYRRTIIDEAGFSPRIVTPEYEFAGEGADVAFSVYSGGAAVLDGAENGKVYYASRDGFAAADDLELRLTVTSGRDEPVRVSHAGVEYLPGAFTLIEPGPGATVYAGEVCLVRWSAAEFGPEYPFVIEWSRDDGVSWQRMDETRNSGVYGWLVPEIAASARIRVRDTYDTQLVYDQSRVPFVIAAPRPQMTVVEPLPQSQPQLRPQVQSETTADEPGGTVTLTRSDKISVELAVAEYRRETASHGEALYDVLIKIGDNPGANELKDGDLMTIRPAGQIWTELERSRYVIVRVYLRPEEVGRYLQASGTGAMRAFRISPAGLGMLADGFANLSQEKRDYLYDKLKSYTFSKEMFEPK